MAFAKLQSETSAGRQVFGCRLDESPDMAKTIRSAVECSRRIVLNLALKAGKLIGNDVWEVRDDAIEPLRQRGEQIRLVKVDPHRVSDRVLASKAQGLNRNIGGPDCGAREFKGQRDRDYPRARANIKNAYVLWSAGKVFNHQLNELLCFRARNKRTPITEKGSSKEFSRPEKVLQRFSGRPISDQAAKWRSLCFRQRTVELEV